MGSVLITAWVIVGAAAFVAFVALLLARGGNRQRANWGCLFVLLGPLCIALGPIALAAFVLLKVRQRSSPAVP